MKIKQSEVNAYVDELVRQATDKGELIELGWLAMRAQLPPEVSTAQLTDMRRTYFMGAQHLFSSIMGLLEAGTEPTANDLMRLTNIHKELETFRLEIMASMPKRKGQ